MCVFIGRGLGEWGSWVQAMAELGHKPSPLPFRVHLSRDLAKYLVNLRALGSADEEKQMLDFCLAVIYTHITPTTNHILDTKRKEYGLMLLSLNV